jgi:hypothetical protein
MKTDFKVAVSLPFTADPERCRRRPEISKPADAPATRLPQIAVLMSLSIHMEQLLRDGKS